VWWVRDGRRHRLCELDPAFQDYQRQLLGLPADQRDVSPFNNNQNTKVRTTAGTSIHA